MLDAPKLNIQIPPDHPKAKRFLELSGLFASRQSYASGIVVDRTPPMSKSDIEAEMMELLREFVPSHVLETFSAQAVTYNAAAKNAHAEAALTDVVGKTIGTPEAMAKTADMLAASGLLGQPARDLMEKVRRAAVDGKTLL